MADRNKFEEMLERLINEDKVGAEELFHEIVVERSREIYENILAEEADDEEVDETTDEEVDESDDEEVEESDDDELDEDFNLDEFEVEADDEMDMDMGGDETDDMLGDLEGDDDEMDMGDEDEGLEDRVVDLEDALDELKAEFEKMMAGEEGEEHDMGDEEEGDMDMGDEEEGEEETEEDFAFESDDEEVEESDDDDVEEGTKSAAEQMREYVEKVTAKMGDNGVNTKSPVAGKNDMGGTTANIAKGNTANDPVAGAGSKIKGSALNGQNAKEDNAGNVNVPGGKASKSLKNQPAGHGAEKKGKPESADKGAGSPLNGVKSRAK